MNQDILRGKKSAKIKDIIKFKCQLLHNVDQDLQAERKRSFKMDMTQMPNPQMRWQHNKAIKRRKLVKSVNQTTTTAANESSMLSSQRQSITTDVSSRSKSPLRMKNLTYDRNILVEDYN